MVILSSDGVRPLREIKIQVAQQPHFMRADKLGNHVIRLVKYKIPVAAFIHEASFISCEIKGQSGC